MKTSPAVKSSKGFSFISVMIMMAISMAVLGGALKWSSQSMRSTDITNETIDAMAAAEAATEKVMAYMTRDYQKNSENYVYSKISTYTTTIPTASESPFFSNFQFKSPASGAANQTYVNRMTSWSYVALDTQYRGLNGYAAAYRVVSNAKSIASGDKGVIGSIGQDVSVASIPIFQFAIFYGIDLEVNPGANLDIRGRVHSNGDLYAQPGAGVTATYWDDVTAAGTIYDKKAKANDQNAPRGYTGSNVWKKGHTSQVTSLNLPIGTNNSADAVYEVIKMPPAGESATSLMGKERFYNKAELVILVTNNSIIAFSGNGAVTSGFAIPNVEINIFVKTNVSFYNKREGENVMSIDIDVAKLKAWTASSTNSLRSRIGNEEVRLIYVADQRTLPTSVQTGVRLLNGSSLPARGLTVATPEPLYVKGHYNAPTSTEQGSTNTINTKPAGFVADAVTILSNGWLDSNSAKPDVDDRVATATTVNGAILAGITETKAGSGYGGGVENFPRFLEKWGTTTFTYNGSMVAMFDSRKAKAPWGGADVYVPPVRKWAFDMNFKNDGKLPPGTPKVITLIRGRYKQLSPGEYNYPNESFNVAPTDY